MKFSFVQVGIVPATRDQGLASLLQIRVPNRIYELGTLRYGPKTAITG